MPTDYRAFWGMGKSQGKKLSDAMTDGEYFMDNT